MMKRFLSETSPLVLGGLVLLAVALALRAFALDAFPPGVQHDEVFVANFAQTILQGNTPIFFELNRGNEPLFMYLTAAMFRVFGENVWALRATAALCGTGALALTWLLARELFAARAMTDKEIAKYHPNADFIALVTTAGIAFSFWHLYESRIGLHTISTYLLAAATFYAFWRGWTRERNGWLFLAGVLAGLATYTYRSGSFVPVTLAMFVGYTLLFHRARWRTNWWMIPIVFGVAALVYAPLFYFITTHPETALARIGDLSGDMAALGQGNPLPLLSNAARVLGMFGVSGDPEWRYNVALRPIFDPVWAILFYGGILIALWRVRVAGYAFALIWLVVMLLPSILSGSDLSQHRAVGAIGAAFMMPALALDLVRAMAVEKWATRGAWAVGVATALLITIAAVGGLNAYFVTWTNNSEVRLIQRADLAAAARWLDEHQGDARALVSAEFANDLDRGAFNLVARNPGRAQFFQGADTFVLPARTKAYVVDTLSGGMSESFRERFLNDAPQYEARRADGTIETRIFELTEEEYQILRTTRGLETIAQAAEGELLLRDAYLPESVRTGETAFGEVWWLVLGPPVSDADGLQWNGALTDEQGYVWSEAASMGYTPSQWQRDDVVITRLPFEIAHDTPPQDLRLELNLAGNNGSLPLTPVGETEALATVRVARGAVPQDKPTLAVRYPSKAKFGDVQLLGSDAVGEASAGGNWQLVLFWEALGELPSNYKLRLTAATEEGTEFARADEILLKGKYPTKQWRQGDFVRSVHALEIPEVAPRGKAVVRVFLLDANDQPVGRADGAPIAGIEILGRVREFDAETPPTSRAARFGERVELVGYDLPTTEAKASEPFAITLYWHALDATDKPYTVFVHLLDGEGRVIGQLDAQPMQGEAPTNGWQAGEYLIDPYSFVVSADAPTGAAAIEIGLYDGETGARLSVMENGESVGDRLLIEGLQVVRE